ncbi:hypothetical protein GGR57DRAFT_80339 [Xylariaceae sp. FL1272]|nr:hypothetical protein GGR57DRAFT_80339 [Xylariaceae sp. FL1272]
MSAYVGTREAEFLESPGIQVYMVPKERSRGSIHRLKMKCRGATITNCGCIWDPEVWTAINLSASNPKHWATIRGVEKRLRWLLRYTHWLTILILVSLSLAHKASVRRCPQTVSGNSNAWDVYRSFRPKISLASPIATMTCHFNAARQLLHQVTRCAKARDVPGCGALLLVYASIRFAREPIHHGTTKVRSCIPTRLATEVSFLKLSHSQSQRAQLYARRGEASY